MTPEEAKAAYQKMAPEEQARVTMLVKQGKKGREAVQNVLDQVEAYESEQPTMGEEIGAGALSVANAASFNLADEAKGAGRALLESQKRLLSADPMSFDELGASYRKGRDEQRQKVSEAQEIAPTGSAAGEIAAIPLGALIPGSAAMKAPGIGAAAMQAGKVGAAQGAAGGFGAGEGAADSGVKALLGTILGGGLGAMTGGGAAALSAARGRVPSPSGGVAAAREKIGSAVNAIDEKVPEAAQDIIPGFRLARRIGKAIGVEPPAPPEPPGPYPGVEWQPASQSSSSSAPAGAADDLLAQYREIVKPKPMQMPAEVMVGGMPTPKPAAPALAPPAASPMAVAPPSPKPPPGVTFSDPTIDPHALADAPVWDAFDDMARRAFMQTVQKMPLAPSASQAAAPMSGAALKAAVEQAVKQGMPLKAISDQLGIPQKEIIQLVRGAQFSQPL